MKPFNEVRNEISVWHLSPVWSDGPSVDELLEGILQIEANESSFALIKAKSIQLLAETAPIAVNPLDLFQIKVNASGLIAKQRKRWEMAVKENLFPEEAKANDVAWKHLGAYHGIPDYGHTSPNSRLLLELGFSGLLARVEEASKATDLSAHQQEFYESCRIVLRAGMHLAIRFSDAIRPCNRACADALAAIAERAPETSYEAMQLLIFYFFYHEYVSGTRVRTLGRLDVLLTPFYEKDLQSGRLTEEEWKELMRFFLFKFSEEKVPFGLPFCLAGTDSDRNEVTNRVSSLIVEVYDELGIYSPKIHIRVSEKTPPAFIKQVLRCIRNGHSSFVFVNDRIAIQALMQVGIEEQDALNYVPIGCYEPAVWGVEIGCTGNGCVNMLKAMEALLNGGRDLATDTPCGIDLPLPENLEELMEALRAELTYMAHACTDFVIHMEQNYDKITPDPLLSCQYDESVRRGVDVYEGGAKYNNSSLYFYSIATLTDAVCAIDRLVYREKRMTLRELADILKKDWEGQETLRQEVLRFPEKYGNHNAFADRIAKELAHYCASAVNNLPNGRGGVFKAALFTIDHYLHTSARTMATPDGRHKGDLSSKNLCATLGMDKAGVTALIHSVTEMDHSEFPNGSVLDIVLHPSAVSGDDGIDAFFAILSTYFKKDGFAFQANVLNAAILKDAQKHPEQYRNLQVRVCGWNAYFNDLTVAEQDSFIRQAELAT